MLRASVSVSAPSGPVAATDSTLVVARLISSETDQPSEPSVSVFEIPPAEKTTWFASPLTVAANVSSTLGSPSPTRNRNPACSAVTPVTSILSSVRASRRSGLRARSDGATFWLRGHRRSLRGRQFRRLFSSDSQFGISMRWPLIPASEFAGHLVVCACVRLP